MAWELYKLRHLGHVWHSLTNRIGLLIPKHNDIEISSHPYIKVSEITVSYVFVSMYVYVYYITYAYFILMFFQMNPKNKEENGTYLSLKKSHSGYNIYKTKTVSDLSCIKHRPLKTPHLFWLQIIWENGINVIQFQDFRCQLKRFTPIKELHIICNAHWNIRIKISLAGAPG